MRNCTISLMFFVAFSAFAHFNIAQAQEAAVTDSVEAPASYIRLTTNHNKLVKLNEDAASVIVNNPAHASIMLDTPRLLIIVPHAPGATSFTVLDKAGKTILQKDIIITNVEKKYVRIRRACNQRDATCKPSSYYYCPDGCYEVTTMEGDAAPNRNALPMRNNSGISDGQQGEFGGREEETATEE